MPFSLSYNYRGTLFAAPALYFASYPAIAVSLLLFGLAYSATWPSYFTYLGRVFPEHLGALAGGALFWGHIGFAWASWVSGRLAEADLAYPIIFGAVLMGAFAFVFYACTSRNTTKGVITS